MDGWVWVGLVVAAVGFLGWVAWGVVVAGLRLGRTLAGAQRALDDATARLGEAVERAEAERVGTGPTMFDDRAVLRGRLHDLRVARRERTAARRVRQEPVWRSWAESTWLERRQASRAERHVNGR